MSADDETAYVAELITRSSLGTEGAKRLRERTPPEVVNRILAHVDPNGSAKVTMDDDMGMALGFVPGKTWPEDAERPGPHYWRVRRGRRQVSHLAWCDAAGRASAMRKHPWWAMDGVPPLLVLVWVRRNPGSGFSLCRRCWKWHLQFADGMEDEMILALDEVLRERGG